MEREIHATPAIADGTVYAGSHDGRLWAVDAATGETHWKVRTTEPVHSTPLVSGGRVYIDSLDEHLYAVRAHRQGEAPADSHRATLARPAPTNAQGRSSSARIAGTLRWRVRVPGAGRFTAAVADGVVYQPGNRDLLALDAATGRERWRLTSRYPFGSSPVVADATLYLRNGKHLWAVETGSGRLRWKRATDYAGDSRPTVADGTV
ncbi:PQQ-binding-like beta-propeller repeat protein [Streptomyces sp. NPDC018036]|uniref:outer membrane protein assembly factor BamB family protein n=1 Tax=Streptomyces sp. NPDC018036 TaxID=3365035 RepID=UPI0037A37FE2